MERASLGQRLSSSVKGGGRFLIVIGAVATVAIVGYFVSSGGDLPPASDIRSPSNTVRNVPGSAAPTADMRRMIDDADRDRQQRAANEGRSALPTVVAQPMAPVDMPNEDRNRQGNGDGIERPDPPVVRPVIAPPVLPVAPVVAAVPVNQVDDGLAELMKRQMEQIARIQFGPADVKYYAKENVLAGAGQSGPSQAQAAAAGAASLVDPLSGLKLPLAGTILYAEMVSTANSDAPGPILARIAQGEFAGATLIGSFETKRDALVLSFKTMTVQNLRDGTEVNKSVTINAVAVDTKEIGTALATDIDRHILTNLGFTAAAAFAQGFGQAIGQSGQTTNIGLGGVTVSNPALSTRQQLYVAGGVAAGAAGQILNQTYGNRPTTVKVASGTPVGILFLPNGNQ
ncbi:conserved hypothetical protein [Hyphomicrobiales bacterium]|jgi:intracellular multiplication protein IcmE|nr:conserved hypothetical protein [Hyphomicrobiales bacterium]CAH1702675.1 Bacterial conjugation TrbI-like family protein [Hyphomicrobiales bacterium]CAI0346865.1 intracellular multiplication protein IcmE [Hyphomicrobiales bacterium]